jgi:hypothetical protein
MIRGMADSKIKKNKSNEHQEEEDLSKGNLFATGLVAGGAIAGVIVAFLSANESIAKKLALLNLEEKIEHAWGQQGYYLLGTLFFFALSIILYRVAIKRESTT